MPPTSEIRRAGLSNCCRDAEGQPPPRTRHRTGAHRSAGRPTPWHEPSGSRRNSRSFSDRRRWRSPVVLFLGSPRKASCGAASRYAVSPLCDRLSLGPVARDVVVRWRSRCSQLDSELQRSKPPRPEAAPAPVHEAGPFSRMPHRRPRRSTSQASTGVGRQPTSRSAKRRQAAGGAGPMDRRGRRRDHRSPTRSTPWPFARSP